MPSERVTYSAMQIIRSSASMHCTRRRLPLPLRRHQCDNARCSPFTRSLLVVCILLAFGGCETAATEPSRSNTRLDPAWLTEETARDIDARTGEFLLTPPTPRYLSKLAAESASIAISRSISARVEFADLRRFLEQQRGSRIEFSALHPCARTTYATASLAELPAAAPGYLRRAFAPYWAVPLCSASRDEAQLSVGIPDAPRDFRVDADTIVRTRPFGGGTNWYLTGLSPQLFPRGLPLSPERAVELAFAATGVRIARVPEPYLQQDDTTETLITSLCASWRLTLENPVKVREQTSGTVRPVTELFVKRTPACVSETVEFYVASMQQPPFRWLTFLRDTLAVPPDPLDSVAVPLVGPRRFEAVTVVRP